MDMFNSTATDLFNKGKKYLKKAEETVTNTVSGVMEQGSSVVNHGTATLQQFPTSVPNNLEISGHKLSFVKLLDEGGFSYVYLVRDETGKMFALKQLIAQERNAYEKIAEEIKYMTLLSGKPGIIQLIGTKVLGGKMKKTIFILMELAKGSLTSALQKKLDAKSHFDEGTILTIFLQICVAVSHLHSQNPPIVHRDIKVENVLYVNGEWKLCDFGSATTKVYQNLETQREISEAEMDIQQNTTLPYRSPEMADLYSGSTINIQSDIWALGCVLYKMCFFVGPFEEASNLQIMNGKYNIPNNPQYSSTMLQFIKYLLVLDPKQRPDIYDVIEKCSKALKKEPPVKRPQGFNPNTVHKPLPKAPTKKETTAPTKKTPTPTSSGGGLFDQLDWKDSNTTAPKTTQKQQESTQGFDDFQVDFSDFDQFSSNQPVVKPPSPINAKPKVQQQTPKSASSVGGGDLFSQLDWKENQTTTESKSTNNSKSKSAATPTAQSGSLFDQLDWNEPSQPQKQPQQHVKQASFGQGNNDLFSQLDWNDNSSSQPKQHVKQPSFDTNNVLLPMNIQPTTTTTTQHIKSPSISSTKSADDLFSQLDWNTASPTKSPVSSKSTLSKQDTHDPFLSTPKSGHVKQLSFSDDLFGSYSTAKSFDPQKSPQKFAMQKNRGGHSKQPSYSDAEDLFGARSKSVDGFNPNFTNSPKINIEMKTSSNDFIIKEPKQEQQQQPQQQQQEKMQISVKDKRIQLIKAITENSEMSMLNVNNLLGYTWSSQKTDVLVFLRSLPIFSDPIACFKGLSLIHILINEGPKIILTHLVNDNSILMDIKDVWTLGKHPNQSLSSLIVDYSNYLISRISFAKKNPEFDGNFSLENFVSKFTEKELNSKIGKYSPFNTNATNDIVSAQKSLIEFSKSFIREISDTSKERCLQQLIYDYSNLYKINSFVLLSLKSKTLVAENFFKNQQDFYQILSSFYKKFSHKKINIPSVIENPSLEESIVPTAKFYEEKISYKGEELTQEEFIYGQSLMNFEVVDDLSLEKILQIKGNDFCADCRSKSPKWASLTLGIFICQNCVQHHRNLGVLVSKVRSTSIEKWSPDQLQFMRGVGNMKANRYWEHSLPRNEVPKNQNAVGKFIQTKYFEQKWMKTSDNIDQASGSSSQLQHLKKGGHSRSKSYNPALLNF